MSNKSYFPIIFGQYLHVKFLQVGYFLLYDNFTFWAFEGSHELTIDLCKKYAISTILTNQRPRDVTVNTLISPLRFWSMQNFFTGLDAKPCIQGLALTG